MTQPIDRVIERLIGRHGIVAINAALARYYQEKATLMADNGAPLAAEIYQWRADVHAILAKG